MPPRAILLIPRHPPRSPDNIYFTALRPAQEPSFSFDQSFIWSLPLSAPIPLFLSSLRLIMVNINATVFCISIRALHTPLNSRDEVKVAVECGGSRELVAAKVGGWIADAGALGPDLVTAGTGEGAGSSRATWTAVFWGVYVAV